MNIEEQIKEIEYFEVETNPVVDKLVNSFIEKNIPNLYPHFVDTDENDGQRLRVQLTQLLKQQEQEIREETTKDFCEYLLRKNDGRLLRVIKEMHYTDLMKRADGYLNLKQEEDK